MADQVIVKVELQLKTTNVNLPFAKGPSAFTVTTERYVSGMQAIGTSEEAIDMGDVTTPGWFYFENLDSTNYVEIRQGTGIADLLRLNAGEFACGRLAADATAPFALANTSTVNLKYIICQT